jgi:hypothetical protein
MLSVKQSEAYFTETVKITVNGKWIGYIVSTGLTCSQVNAKVNSMINRNFPPGTVTTSNWEFV